jgi:Fic family protein
MIIGSYVKQPRGYSAFIPSPFPPKEEITLSLETIRLLEKADLLVGKLDGITQTLPNLDFFIFMYVRKEAALSSEIEGTKATMVDSIKAELEISKALPKDVDDILHYIQAMNHGLKRLNDIPLSLRLIKDAHQVLMTKARGESFAYPGEFRNTQNWIGGTKPDNAKFVPPPPYEMKLSLNDFELYLHKEDTLPILIKTALIHAQFETIHPFIDGNGRTGRLLITFYLCHQHILDKPVLYLSEFFKRNRELYFDLLENYHNKGEVAQWINFVLEGIASVSQDAIVTSKRINALRDRDRNKIDSYGGSPKAALTVLDKLYELPIVNARKIQVWTGFSRVGSNDLIRKLVNIGILQQKDKSIDYDRTFEYSDYLKVFI